MPRRYVHLSLEDRRKIARWHDARMPVLEIAARLGRHRATIHRELKRNRFVDAELQHLSGYYALNAQSKAEARRAGVPFVDQRWLGGMLTNFKTVKTSIKRLKDMQAQQEAGLESMTKKEQLLFAREMEKLEKDIGGIQDMTALPDAIFVIDVGFHKITILEAQKLGIPLVGVVDTNHNPVGIDYVIPGNDDSARAVALYARGIADAILEGRSNAVNDVVKAVKAEGSDEFVEVKEDAAA